MWITRESSLGLLALVEIARSERVSAEEIARKYGLSASFLRQVLGRARRAGLVESRRDGVRILWRLASPEIPRLLHCIESLACEKQVSR